MKSIVYLGEHIELAKNHLATTKLHRAYLEQWQLILINYGNDVCKTVHYLYFYKCHDG